MYDASIGGDGWKSIAAKSDQKAYKELKEKTGKKFEKTGRKFAEHIRYAVNALLGEIMEDT